MPTSEDATGRILSLIQRLEGAPTGQVADVAAEIRALETALQASAESWFAGIPDADRVAAGLKRTHAAIALGIAAKALDTAAAWQIRPGVAPALAERVGVINRRLARRELIGALQPLALVEGSDAAPVPPEPTGRRTLPAAAPLPAAVPEAARPADLSVLGNMAAFHREHERHYTQNTAQSAVDLIGEANRLRIVAGVWLEDRPTPVNAGIDFTDPRYRAAGCVDLNAFAAIPMIGIMFMEGEGEPAEIRVIKSRLEAEAAAGMRAGQWLSSKMDAAWVREQAVYTPALIDAAQARFNAIANNWRGAMEFHLRARLIGFTLALLNAIDFRPPAIRAARAVSGRTLLHAAWILAMAGQLGLRSAADLGDNDRNWTVYLDVLARQVGQA